MWTFFFKIFRQNKSCEILKKAIFFQFHDKNQIKAIIVNGLFFLQKNRVKKNEKIWKKNLKKKNQKSLSSKF